MKSLWSTLGMDNSRSIGREHANYQDVYHGGLFDYEMEPDISSNRRLCYDVYVEHLIAELGINGLKTVEETLEHLNTKTRV